MDITTSPLRNIIVLYMATLQIAGIQSKSGTGAPSHETLYNITNRYSRTRYLTKTKYARFRSSVISLRIQLVTEGITKRISCRLLPMSKTPLTAIKIHSENQTKSSSGGVSLKVGYRFVASDRRYVRHIVKTAIVDKRARSLTRPFRFLLQATFLEISLNK